MGMPLSADDLARLEGASRALLSPLAAPDARAWRAGVLSALRELLGTNRTFFALPLDGRLDYYTDDMDGADVQRFAHFVTEPTPGFFGSTDGALDRWFTQRRAHRLPLYNDAVMDGYTDGQYTRSPFHHEVTTHVRMYDHQGLSVDLPGGEALVCLAYDRPDSARPGWDRLAVLRALLPSLQAGVEGLLRLSNHRHALDAVGEALVAFHPDGTEIHRNRAFLDMAAADPEVRLLEAELLRMAADLRRFAFPLRRDAAGLASPVRTVATQRGTYTLRGSLLPPGAFTSEASYLVAIQCKEARAPFPTAAELCAREALTRREAETALLVAHGLSNESIAEKLFVSPHTVRHHVENVMAKLGLTGQGRQAVAPRLMGIAAPAQA